MFPSKNDILIGIAFVFVGLINALSEKWLVAVNFPGIQGEHMFDHLFFLWALQQLLQLCLFALWKGIDKNWLGLGYFKHKDRVYGANASHSKSGLNDNHTLNINDEEDEHDGNGHPLDSPVSDNDVSPGAGYIPPDRHHEDNEPTNNDDHEALLPDPNGEELQAQCRITKPSFWIYLPPALFAQAYVLMLYFGLKLTYPSSFIMLKGTCTFFTALLSMAFLAQQLASYVWFGVLVATLGFAVSGISDYVHVPSNGYEKFGIAAGNLLIVMAQIMFATKIIYEEKFIRKHSIHPMLFLGSEAIYGSVFAVGFTIAFSFVDGDQYSNLPNGKIESVDDAWFQIRHSWRVTLAVLGSLSSYILFTYLGMYLIRDQGALPRIMIETFVWSIYWAVCLILKWEDFYIGQVPGLCVIAIGTLIYSHILVLPFCSRMEGIDPSGGSFSDHFLDLNKPDPTRHNQIEPDGTPLPDGNDNEGRRNSDDAESSNAYNENTSVHKVIVELHHNESEDEDLLNNLKQEEEVQEGKKRDPIDEDMLAG